MIYEVFDRKVFDSQQHTQNAIYELSSKHNIGTAEIIDALEIRLENYITDKRSSLFGTADVIDPIRDLIYSQKLKDFARHSIEDSSAKDKPIPAWALAVLNEEIARKNLQESKNTNCLQERQAEYEKAYIEFLKTLQDVFR